MSTTTLRGRPPRSRGPKKASGPAVVSPLPGEKQTHSADPAQAKASSRLATIEGIPSAVALGIVNNYVVPCALALRATTFQVGMLSAVPQLGAALAQLKAPDLMDRLKSPKKTLLISVLLGALPFLALAGIAPVGTPSVVWWLLSFSTMALVLYNLPNAAWGTWVSAIVPASTRGWFLGVRSSISAAATIIAFLACGWLLDLMDGRVLVGFSAIFAIAAVSRVVSFLLFTRMHEPAGSYVQAPRASLREAIRALSRNNMGRFLFWYGAIMFSASMSGPFFAVYMLRDLHFSYTTYTFLTMVPSITSVVAPFLFGRLADRRGNVKMLRVITWGISITPAMWLVSHAIPWIVFVQLFAGAMWAGFQLVTLNFVYSASTETERPANIAYLFVVNGIAAACGNLLGGAIAPHLPALFGYSLLTLFALSGTLRGLASLTLLPRVREQSKAPAPEKTATAA